MKNILGSLPARLLLGVIAGILVGLYANEALMQVILTIKNLLGSLIIFCVPLIIIGFIAPSITRLGQHASTMLRVAITLAYVSSVGAAFFAMFSGYGIIPHLNIVSSVDGLKELPKLLFDLKIDPIMSVMSALVFSVLIGVAAAWTKAAVITKFLEEFQKIVLAIVTNIVIPLLPIFIACTFCALSYEGTITKQLPVFLIVVLIVMVGHYIWLALLYGLAGIYAGANPMEVLKHYWPAYITAVGTMSSAATLAVALECARKSKVLRKDLVNFGIPLFANIHLCGSVLTEVFFVMTVSQILYGALPELGTDSPHLYDLSVSVGTDNYTQRFGFRWFEVKDIHGDKQFFLNGKRIVLRTAISWSFWPDNGITPSDELARRQVESAKKLGRRNNRRNRCFRSG